ncbi:hypothetical protein BDW02DRAFT_507469 [Decorospora gaudefroyi]|uniref:Uncharacterized protein n=1 Tax=Decorospora gaudefroyi TaxID=184978 RepID=A0A6A5K149_9PLEO|nr:hypothetical protein BDW02DRAFT_507469 [Decorospora gaudefroyi]
MFVPRVLRLKGLREKARPGTAKPAPKPVADRAQAHPDDAPVEARQQTSTNAPAHESEQHEAKVITKSPRFSALYVAELAAGMELIFSVYAHQEEQRVQWLQRHYRTVDGGETYIHLAAILEHPNITSMKPEANIVLLQQALRDHPSKTLQVSQNGYYVRRSPSSYLPKYLPDNSFEVVDDQGLAFWDQRTIYVEPHARAMCQAPARVAHWLVQHGQLREKWLPIQAVHTLFPSCAFVVLSGSVMHDDIWQKWRETEQPEDWIIMTKVEHTRRDAEYEALLKQENPRRMRKARVDDSELPPVARPATLPMAMDTTGGDTAKPKRKRRRVSKSARPTHNADTNSDSAGDTDDEPSSKRRA